MIIVREYFIAKPGQASKLAKLLQEAQKLFGATTCRIMTDMTGDFNQVVMETEVESLGADRRQLRLQGVASEEGLEQARGELGQWDLRID